VSTHAAPHGEALVVAGLVGLGFEVIQDGVEGVRGGDGIMFGEKLTKEPVAKGGRAGREDVETAGGGFVQADEGLAVTGREGDAAAGNAKEMRQRRSWTHEITTTLSFAAGFGTEGGWESEVIGRNGDILAILRGRQNQGRTERRAELAERSTGFITRRDRRF